MDERAHRSASGTKGIKGPYESQEGTINGWPWIYLFTASQTELGKSEKWFWKATPRKIVAMLNEKKRIDLEKWKVQGYLNQGGQIEDDENEKGVPGIDFPFEGASVF